MKLFITNIDEIYSESQYHNYKMKLTQNDLRKYETINNILKKRQFLLGRMLLYENYGKNYSIDKNGKLCTQSKYVSISHSDHFVILGISDKPIGVDLENLNKQRDFKQLSQFLNLPITENCLDFYKNFTAYEANFKLSENKKTCVYQYYLLSNFLLCIATFSTDNNVEIYDAIPYFKYTPVKLNHFNRDIINEIT